MKFANINDITKKMQPKAKTESGIPPHSVPSVNFHGYH